ncbi:MAG: YvcK family protein [Candidatus Omnitrophica bacterium]|nr:YvcK family protein [Candidatus Omnitrophota bacterium]
MKRLKWLYPGMLIKRWISLSVIGIVMVAMGFVIVIAEKIPENKTIAGLIIILGIMIMVYAVKRIFKTLVTALVPQSYDSLLVDKVYEKHVLVRGPKIVVIGGGTGLSTLLTGLKTRTSNITAIVTVADDGGSSGRLRKEFDVLPPGDIRNCLVALSDSEDILGPLFQFRFEEGKELEGHNFGNLFITALSKITGDFNRAIRESSKVLNIRGSVFPATLDKVQLIAERQDGRRITGESRIREESGSPIVRMYITPEDCEASSEALEAIKKADVIVLGPGSLYTSVMPNLLISGIKDTITGARGIKIYVCNIMTEYGETDDYSVSEHAKAVIKHTAGRFMDYCVCNTRKIPERLSEKYKIKKQFPVKTTARDEEWFSDEKILLIKADIASMEEFVRHDPRKLSDVIMNIYNAAKHGG